MASSRAWLALAALGLAFGGCECISDPAKGGRNRAGNGTSSSGATAGGPSSTSSGASSASTSGPGTDTGSGSSHGAGSGGASAGAGTASGSGAGTVSSSGTSAATQGGSTGPGSTAGSTGSTATASTSTGGPGSTGSVAASTGAASTGAATAASSSSAGSTAGAGTSSGSSGAASSGAGPATGTSSSATSSSSSSTTLGGTSASSSSSGAGTIAGSTGGVGTTGTTCAPPTYGTVTTSGGSGTTIVTSIGGPGPVAPHGAPWLGTTTGGYSGLSSFDGGVVVVSGSTTTTSTTPDAGSVGTIGSTGSTGFADAGSPTTTTTGTTGTPPPQVREWAAWHMPDSVDQQCVQAGSVVGCNQANRQPDGQDGDYLTNPTSYSSVAIGSLTDAVTGLRWSVEGATSPSPAVDFATAAQFCSQYSANAGEFRLPTPIELASLLDLGQPSPNPLIASVFADTQLDTYWSQLSSTSNKGVAWRVSFITGFLDEVGLTATAQVRCVSDWGAAAPPWSAPSDFTTYDADGGVSVANSYTGLEWQAYPSSAQLTWDDALAYCNALADQDPCRPWRLPSYKELLTLVDFAGGGTLDANFPWAPSSSGSGPQYGTFWSSSPAPNAPSKSLAIDFPQVGGGLGQQVGLNARQTTTVLQVRCVRNYP